MSIRTVIASHDGQISDGVMVSLQRQFVFVHIPKTGGNSVQNILRHYSEDEIVCLAPHQDGVERFEVRNAHRNLKKHSTLRDYQYALGEVALSRMFKFCCVRNPWERAISYYFSPHRGLVKWDRHEFLRALKELHPVQDFLVLGGRSAFENVDYIMRFERLEEDFQKVCSRLGIPPTLLPVRNKSEHTHYSKYYDPELVQIVRCHSGQVIDLFGYEFEPAPQEPDICKSSSPTWPFPLSDELFQTPN